MARIAKGAIVTLDAPNYCINCKMPFAPGSVVQYLWPNWQVRCRRDVPAIYTECRERIAKAGNPQEESPKEIPHAPVKPSDKPLTALLETLVTEVRQKLEADGVFNVKVDTSMLAGIVDDALAKLPHRRVVFETQRDPRTFELPEIRHKQMETVMMLVEKGLNVHLYDAEDGGPGSGKSSMAKLIAKLMGLEFHIYSFTTTSSESKVAGFMNAVGDFVSTAFYKAYKFGGMVCAEEMGFAPSYIAGFLNPALANGICAFPNGETVEKHADFRWFSCDQTALGGGNKDFAERRAQDKAFVSRLTSVAISYDKDYEKALVLGFGKANGSDDDSILRWFRWFQESRRILQENGAKTLADPRALYSGSFLLKLANTGVIPKEKMVDMVLFKGLCNKDTRDKVLTANPLNF